MAAASSWCQREWSKTKRRKKIELCCSTSKETMNQVDAISSPIWHQLDAKLMLKSLISKETMHKVDANRLMPMTSRFRLIQQSDLINPHNLTRGGVELPPGRSFRCHFGTTCNSQISVSDFSKYVWAMRWHNPGISIIIQNSNMAAAKPEIVKFSKNSRYKALYLRSQTRYRWHYNGVT